MNKVLTPADLAKLFGTTESDVRERCGSLLENADLAYRVLEGKERDALLLDVLHRLESLDLPSAGESRHGDWEKGWGENLDELTSRGFDPSALVPKYIRPMEPIRLYQEYCQPTGPGFVLDYYKILRSWLFKTYLSDVDAIYEFGCGPGWHLAWLAETFPEKRLFGLDWAEASVNILRSLAKHMGWKLEGRRFDFFNPDLDMTLAPNSGVFTFGALEQIDDRHGPFLNYLLDRKPAVVVHVEPFVELYDDSVLTDHLAVRYHRKRHYLNGLFSRLRELEGQGHIAIDKVCRNYCGTKFAETLSMVVWRPL